MRPLEAPKKQKQKKTREIGRPLHRASSLGECLTKGRSDLKGCDSGRRIRPEAVCLKEVDPAGYFTSRKVYYRRPFRESLSLAEVSYLRLYLILKVSGRKQKEIEEKRGRKGGRVGMDKER